MTYEIYDKINRCDAVYCNAAKTGEVSSLVFVPGIESLVFSSAISISLYLKTVEKSILRLHKV